MKPLRQSFSFWCSVDRGIETDALLAGAAKIGFEAVDLVDESLWPAVKRSGVEVRRYERTWHQRYEPARERSGD